MKKDILKDNYCESGSGMQSLSRFADDLDSCTRIVKVYSTDITVVNILRVIGTEGYGVMIEPGRSIVDNINKRKPELQLPPIGAINFGSIINDGFEYLLQEIRTNPKNHSTLFNIDGKMYFSGECLGKTLNARFKVPTWSSMQRDLLLGQMLDNAPGDGKYYCVARVSGQYRKMLAIFGTNNFQKFGKFVDLIPHGGNCIAWEYSHKEGLVATVEYDDEVSEIKKLYPGMKYHPVHIFQLNDTGYVSNSVSSGWMTTSYKFVTASNALSSNLDNMENMVKKSRKQHMESAKQYAESSSHVVKCENKDDFVRLVIEQIGSDEVIRKKGLKKAAIALAEYSEKKYKEISDIQYIRNVALEAIESGVLSDVSESANNWLIENAAGKIFSGKTA